jgi:amidase
MEPSSAAPVRITTEHLAVVFDATAAPAVEVDPGSVVSFETSDTVLAQIAAGKPIEEIDFEQANTVTGPVCIRGAEPGDALRIEVIDIEIDRAWVVWMQGFGPLGSHAEGIQAVPAPISDGRVNIGDGLTAPLDPMVGCIGVAPADGAASTMRPVYATGGNLDLRDLSPGTILWLPVQVPGALLSLGDLHAAMGEGEPAFIAIEAAGTATVRVDLDKRSPLRLPRLRKDGQTICVGMGDSFPEARQSAVEQAFELLTGAHGLAPLVAYSYVCARVGLRPAGPSGSMVDGLEAVLAVVPDPQ